MGKGNTLMISDNTQIGDRSWKQMKEEAKFAVWKLKNKHLKFVSIFQKV